MYILVNFGVMLKDFGPPDCPLGILALQADPYGFWPSRRVVKTFSTGASLAGFNKKFS